MGRGGQKQGLSVEAATIFHERRWWPDGRAGEVRRGQKPGTSEVS